MAGSVTGAGAGAGFCWQLTTSIINNSNIIAEYRMVNLFILIPPQRLNQMGRQPPHIDLTVTSAPFHHPTPNPLLCF